MTQTVFRSFRLLHLWCVAPLLDATPGKVLGMIEDGTLRWAWNIAARKSRSREVRVLADSVADVLNGRPAQPETGDEWVVVAESIIPASRPSVTAPELAQTFSCGTRHLMGLISAGELPASNARNIRRGPGGSAVIARQSVLAWLKSRRVF
jgi:hypothetical protein